MHFSLEKISWEDEAIHLVLRTLYLCHACLVFRLALTLSRNFFHGKKDRKKNSRSLKWQIKKINKSCEKWKGDNLASSECEKKTNRQYDLPSFLPSWQFILRKVTSFVIASRLTISHKWRHARERVSERASEPAAPRTRCDAAWRRQRFTDSPSRCDVVVTAYASLPCALSLRPHWDVRQRQRSAVNE